MYPVAVPAPGGEGSNGQHGKLIFFLFVFGAVLLCAGFLLSVFILQSCPSGSFSDCNEVLKAAGPVLAVTGLVCVLLARSRARMYIRQRQLQNEQVYSLVFCRGNCQFAQFLIFGFLFLTSGMLISILGIWVPGCSPGWHMMQLNHTGTSDVDLQGCGFLSLQIMGPLIVLTGLCFFVIAHVKKKQNLNLNQESCESEEHAHSPEPFQVTVGDAVMVFPPPPPSYFADPMSPTVTRCLMSSVLPTNDSPPPYHSIFSDGTFCPLGPSHGLEATTQRAKVWRGSTAYWLHRTYSSPVNPCSEIRNHRKDSCEKQLSRFYPWGKEEKKPHSTHPHTTAYK